MKNLSGKANYDGLFDKKEPKNETIETNIKTEIDGIELLNTIASMNTMINRVQELYLKTPKKDLNDALTSLNMARNSLININDN